MISAIVCIVLGVWLIHIGRSVCALSKEIQQAANEEAKDAMYGGTEIEPFRVGRN